MSKGQGNSYQKNKSMCINKTRALHSEFFSKIRVEFRVGTSFSRVETSSEGSDITEIFPKFEKSQFPKLAKTKISEKTSNAGPYQKDSDKMIRCNQEETLLIK